MNKLTVFEEESFYFSQSSLFLSLNTHGTFRIRIHTDCTVIRNKGSVYRTGHPHFREFPTEIPVTHLSDISKLHSVIRSHNNSSHEIFHTLQYFFFHYTNFIIVAILIIFNLNSKEIGI